MEWMDPDGPGLPILPFYRRNCDRFLQRGADGTGRVKGQTAHARGQARRDPFPVWFGGERLSLISSWDITHLRRAAAYCDLFSYRQPSLSVEQPRVGGCYYRGGGIVGLLDPDALGPHSRDRRSYARRTLARS